MFRCYGEVSLVPAGPVGALRTVPTGLPGQSVYSRSHENPAVKTEGRSGTADNAACTDGSEVKRLGNRWSSVIFVVVKLVSRFTAVLVLTAVPGSVTRQVTHVPATDFRDDCLRKQGDKETRRPYQPKMVALERSRPRHPIVATLGVCSHPVGERIT